MFGGVPAGLLLSHARSVGAYYQLELPLDTPPFVFVSPEHLCHVVEALHYYHGDKRNGVMSTVDHPSFNKTRRWLESNGYIKTEDWWNGDVVLKPFYFNNIYMDVGDKFLCGSAMGCGDKYKSMYNDGVPKFDTPNYKKRDSCEDW